ncbi:MAG: iron-sulfur cluster repair di-iron protein [Melioribacter sp.]|uniref:iron-sulfur cluster repair di-iron protein n=1 Tax=Rosettibacter primus TaxID=3111523 RepID=UPI00247D8C9E|nr:iron-sulfur cluster repair di-iron protein [Melioribacter sp.]
MNSVNINQPQELINLQLKELVSLNIKTAEIFEKYNIDFCCNGKLTLQEVLTEKNIEPDEILNELINTFDQEVLPNENFIEWNLIDLINHIVNVHHSYVRNSIPKIKMHLEKVISKHGQKYFYLSEVKSLFEQLSLELENHMIKEEKILFPLIKYLVDTEKFNERPKTQGYGSIKNPIRQMELEHDNAGNIIHTIRKITNNYSLPEDACTTFSLTYDELNDFEKDIHKHIHLENNILFPKAIELEDKLLNQ